MRRRVMVVVAMLAGSLGAASPAAAGAPDVVFTSIFLGANCFEAEYAGPTGPVSLNPKSSSGVPKGGLGYGLLDPGPFSDCFAEPIVGGDTIEIDSVTDRVVDVPRLRLKAIDRATDVVTIKGDAGLDVELQVWRCRLTGGFNEGNCPVIHTRQLTLDSSGTRKPDLSSAVDLRGYDQVYLEHRSADDDRFHLRASVPVVFFRRGSAQFHHILFGDIATTYRLLSSGGSVRGTDAVEGAGTSEGEIGEFRKNGVPVAVKTGNRIRTSDGLDPNLVVPAGITSADPATDVVSGTCFADRKLVIQGAGPDKYGKAKGNGRFTVNLSASGFQAGWDLTLICQSARGDAVEMEFHVPG